MPVVELIGYSGNAGSGDYERRPYHAIGYVDVASAISAVAGVAPPTILGMVLQSIEVGEQTEQGWECEATYGAFRKKEPPQEGEQQFNFEIAVQPVKVYVGVAPHVVYPAAGVTAPAGSARWIIGDKNDGDPPEGVEVFEPATSFSYTCYLADSLLTEAYRTTLMRLVGVTNNAAYKGWATGEVLFSGISGSKRGYSDWEVSFRFQAKPNQTGLTVAGISGINKKGWEYLWPRYRLEKDSAAPGLFKVVDYIVISTVFRSGDLSALGI